MRCACGSSRGTAWGLGAWRPGNGGAGKGREGAEAVEHARTVLVSSTSGVSAVVDPDGDVRRRAEILTAATFVEPVALSDATTAATRLGAWPEGLMTAAALLAVAWALLAGRRRRSGAAHPEEPPEPRPATSVGAGDQAGRQ